MSEVIKCGYTKGGFYAVFNHGNYSSLWVIEEQPENLKPETVERFAMEHEDEGWSVAGSLEQVEAELVEVLEQ